MSISLKSNSIGTQHALALGYRATAFQNSTIRMSSGLKNINPYDNAGQLSASTRMDANSRAGIHLGNQLLNSLSFLETQKGFLENVSSILSKITTLRTSYNNSFMSELDKKGYAETFNELQLELSVIAKKKFNDISIFSERSTGGLFDTSYPTDKLSQQSDAVNTTDSVGITRWSLSQKLSVDIEVQPVVEDDVTIEPPGDLIAFAISDESDGTYLGSPVKEQSFADDLSNWSNFVGSDGRNIDAKIALVRAEEAGFGKSLIPPGEEMPDFAKLYEVLPRDGGSPDNAALVSTGIDVLSSAFLDMTNNGTQLPKGIGIFVDDTGSLGYQFVDGAVQGFTQWVRDNFPEVAVHPVTKNDGNWNNGIYMISDERWIQQSINAIQDLLDDPDFPVNEGEPTPQGPVVKSLFDNSFNLPDYNISELVSFQEAITSALAQNAAEIEAVQFAYDDISNLSAIRSNAASISEGTDYSTESTRLIKSQFLIEGGASLLNKFKDLTATALKVLGE